MLDSCLEEIEMSILEVAKYMDGGITYDTMESWPLTKLYRHFDHVATLARKETEAHKKAARGKK